MRSLWLKSIVCGCCSKWLHSICSTSKIWLKSAPAKNWCYWFISVNSVCSISVQFQLCCVYFFCNCMFHIWRPCSATPHRWSASPKPPQQGSTVWGVKITMDGGCYGGGGWNGLWAANAGQQCSDVQRETRGCFNQPAREEVCWSGGCGEWRMSRLSDTWD